VGCSPGIFTALANLEIAEAMVLGICHVMPDSCASDAHINRLAMIYAVYPRLKALSRCSVEYLLASSPASDGSVNSVRSKAKFRILKSMEIMSSSFQVA
jgi:hypothetical protein